MLRFFLEKLKSKNERGIFCAPHLYRRLCIESQDTPNPNCIKIMPGTKVLEAGQTMDIPSLEAAKFSPLARMIFRCDGIVGSDFLTLTKNDGADWKLLKPRIFASLTEFFASGLSTVVDAKPFGATPINEDDDEVVQMIKEILDAKVRPTAHEHGGDAMFVDFKDGVLRLKMLGTCSSCPNSAETLKNWILSMIQLCVPEVITVQRVDDVDEMHGSNQLMKK